MGIVFLPELYLQVRQQEGRLYPDEIVAALPHIPADDPLAGEWQARAASCKRLVDYVAGLPKPVRILDLGCGNGWLSHQLALLEGARVWGLDLQGPELKQAARLFVNRNAGFLAADIFRSPFPQRALDIIVVASAIQYFPDLILLIRSLRDLLSPRGELHILDSPLYEESELPAARERTRAYYTGLGFPEMADRYFHHTFAELSEFAPRWLYRPGSIGSRLRRSLRGPDSPFPWLCIGSSLGRAVI